MGESPSNCSFHLRQLAKYGFVEEAEGGTGRQRPWRVVHVGMRVTDVHEDTDTALAAGALERVVHERWLSRARAGMEQRQLLPDEWRAVTGSDQMTLYVTPAEMKELNDELLAPLPLSRADRRPVEAAGGLAADRARRVLLPGRSLMRRVLARRDMRLYVAGQTLSVFGDTALWLALGVWAKTLTGSSAAAGMVIFFLAAPQLLSPLAGLLADRVRRRPLLIAANLVTAVAVLPLLARPRPRRRVDHLRRRLAYGFSFTRARGRAVGAAGDDAAGGRARRRQRDPADRARGAAARRAAGRRRAVRPAGGAAVALLDAATFVLAAGASPHAGRRAAARAAHGRPLAELAAGARHLWRAVPLRQMTVACAVALLVIGFSETLTFEVAGTGLGRDAAFVGVCSRCRASARSPALRRRRARAARGRGRRRRLGMLVFSVGVTMLTSGALAVVLAGLVLFGIGIPWIVVGLFTLLQRTTPGALQGRVYSAVEVRRRSADAVDRARRAAGRVRGLPPAAAVEALVVAAAGTWLLTRAEQRVRAPH